MAVTMMGRVDVEARSHAVRGALVSAVGLAVIAWWIWTWTKVHDLLADHVAAWGPLPVSASERSALYASGTPAERQLSGDLSAMTGLYPWGHMPLLIGGIVAVIGLAVAFRRDRLRVALSVGVVIVVIVAASRYLGDTVSVALDILE